jgi:hypothetical protein
MNRSKDNAELTAKNAENTTFVRATGRSPYLAPFAFFAVISISEDRTT